MNAHAILTELMDAEAAYTEAKFQFDIISGRTKTGFHRKLKAQHTMLEAHDRLTAAKKAARTFLDTTTA